MEMLEANWRTFCALKGVDEASVNIGMKERVAKVLEESGFAQQRTSEMDVDDFLKLLAAFHRDGIHFC